MTETEHSQVTRYLARVRRGLRGLPNADVDDTVEEMRTHLFEEIGERGGATEVLADFGDAAEVASTIVERRVRPEDGPPVPQASLGRRYSAWATDVVIGFGPLVIVPTVLYFLAGFAHFAGARVSEGLAPIWLQLSANVARAWMSPAQRAAAGVADAWPIPAWQWLLLAAMLAWAGYYWIVLRREHSSSVGMWMTGLRAVRVADERVVIRERDIAQDPPPLGAGRNRWWILLVAVPIGCWCILLALFYVTAGVSMFLDPLQQPRSAVEVQEYEREAAVVREFEVALESGDASAVRALCAPEALNAADELLRRVADADAGDLDLDLISERGTHLLVERSYGDGAYTERFTRITVGKYVDADGHTYTETYRITRIEPDAPPTW